MYDANILTRVALYLFIYLLFIYYAIRQPDIVIQYMRSIRPQVPYLQDFRRKFFTKSHTIKTHITAHPCISAKRDFSIRIHHFQLLFFPEIFKGEHVAVYFKVFRFFHSSESTVC